MYANCDGPEERAQTCSLFWALTVSRHILQYPFPAGHNVEATSIQRWFNDKTLYQRWTDIVSTLHAYWDWFCKRAKKAHSEQADRGQCCPFKALNSLCVAHLMMCPKYASHKCLLVSKNIKWAGTQHFLQNCLSAQWRLRSSFASAQADQSSLSAR